MILTRELQKENALSPIFVTEEGIVILDSELQPPNVPTPISVTDEGIVILDREAQPSNAPTPISVTDEGIVILDRESQPSNAPPLISVTEEGIVTLSRARQPLNAPLPIFVTEEGMVKDLNSLAQNNSIVPSLEYLAPSFDFCGVIDRSSPRADKVMRHSPQRAISQEQRLLLIDIKYPRKATRENGGSEYQRAKTPFALDSARVDFIKERLAVSSKRPPFGPARPLGRSRIAGLEEKRAAVIVRPVLERES